MWQILEGGCRESLAQLTAGSVQTCVTSPPYFGLRDYGHDGQIGLEPTPDEFVAALVAVFREVRRVLRDDGTVWLNLGDSYASSPPGNSDTSSSGLNGAQSSKRYAERLLSKDNRGARTYGAGIKQKDLVGIPWMVAFALRADGWYLRSDVIWAKPNPMPESVTDRPTKAHEYLFLLSKGPRYFYDADAIREDPAPSSAARAGIPRKIASKDGLRACGALDGQSQQDVGTIVGEYGGRRNRRSVWTVATAPYPGAHFATFPPKLIEPCILAGSREGDTVLDPFSGSGTTGMVALRHGRSYIGCELNPEYVRLSRDRIIADSPLLNTHAEAA